MTAKSQFLLHEALSMTPGERARIAQCLIQSLEEPSHENVDAEWLQLAQKRMKELENGTVQPVSWEEIKKRVMARGHGSRAWPAPTRNILH